MLQTGQRIEGPVKFVNPDTGFGTKGLWKIFGLRGGTSILFQIKVTGVFFAKHCKTQRVPNLSLYIVGNTTLLYLTAIPIPTGIS